MTRKCALALLTQLVPGYAPTKGTDPRRVLDSTMADRGLELGMDNATGDWVVFAATDKRNEEVFLARVA